MDYFLLEKLNHLTGQALWFDGLIIFLAQYLICFLPMLAVLFYFLAKPAQKDKYRQAFIRLLFILLLAELIYLVIGLIYHRLRPTLIHPALNQLLDPGQSPSFPSNHTILTFVFSLVILRANKILGIIFLVLAFLIGLSRIVAGVHYPSDILAGIIIALLSTWLINKIMRK